MSWSVSAIGKLAAVKASIAEQFTRNPCSEPEESIRQSAAKTIDAALSAQDGVSVIKVMASGSQGFKDYTAKNGIYNQLNITIEPQHGFLE